jgi:hypothetical protein
MYWSTTLGIRGHRDDAVPNTFFAQDSETHHLAFVFPGLSYTTHMPVLYLPTTTTTGARRGRASGRV